MSRIGKKPIVLLADVSVEVKGNMVVVKGPRGSLSREMHPAIGVAVKEGAIVVNPIRADKKTPALWGLTRALLANMVEGVVKGFEKRLEFEGVGYRAALEGDALVMQLGFSHPVRVPASEGIKLQVEKGAILVSGIDKERVGEVAARIRNLKPVEPYKGKGIRYRGEVVRRKAGKKAVAAG